jgi:hypothetical protein
VDVVEVGLEQAGPLIGHDRVVSEGARAFPDALDAGAERDPQQCRIQPLDAKRRQMSTAEIYLLTLVSSWIRPLSAAAMKAW